MSLCTSLYNFNGTLGHFIKMYNLLIHLVHIDTKSVLSVHLGLKSTRKFITTSVKVYIKQLRSYDLHNLEIKNGRKTRRLTQTHYRLLIIQESK